MACPEELRINIRLLPFKFTYFFILAAVASLLPYLTVYMRQAGLSEVECGIIYGTMPFIGAFARPIFGGIADKYQKHKAVLMLAIVMSSTFHALLFAIPHHKLSTKPYNSSVVPINMTCGTDTRSSEFTFCPHGELMKMGCVENEFTEHFGRAVNDLHKLPDPLGGLRNCTLLCRFATLNNLNKLCIRHNGADNESYSDDCPIKKNDDPSKVTNGGFSGVKNNKFSSHLSNVIEHYLKKARFQMSLLMEKMHHIGLRYTTSENGTYFSNVCHKYSASRFDFNNKTYDHNWVFQCDVKSDLVCELDCGEPPVNLTKTPGYDCLKEHQYYGKAFWMFFWVYFIAQLWFAPIFTLIDGIVYDYLGEDRGKWGRTRMFGTMGFVLFGVISGLLMDVYAGDDGMKNYAPAFILFPVMSLLAAMTACLFNVSNQVKCGQIFKNVLSLVKELKIVIFMTMVLLFGVDTGVIETFLFLHLQDIGASQLLLGLCMMMNCILEVMILFAAGTIIERIGHIACFYIVFAANFLRLFLYSFLSNPWVVLAIEPLHSITFGLFYASASSYGSTITPPGLHGTIQGLLGGLYFGIGKGIGGVTSGKLYQVYGPHLMFRVYAIITAVGFCMYALLQFFCFKEFPKYYSRSATSEPKQKPEEKGVKKPLGSNGKIQSNGYNAAYDPDEAVSFSRDKELLVFKDGAFEADGDLGTA